MKLKILTLIIWLAGSSVHADNGAAKAAGQSAVADSCTSLVAGLNVAGKGLATTNNGYGDVDYWIHHFEIRRDSANAMADSLERVLPSIADGMLRFSLAELASDIRSAPQTGYGNVNYWTGIQAQQDRVLERVADKVSDLLRLVDTKPNAPFQTKGFLNGLAAAAALISTDVNGYGNSKFWTHHFEVRRDVANTVSDGIVSILPRVENPLLRLTLQEIAADIRSAPQNGYGNVYYWTGQTAAQQRVFERVAQKIYDLQAANGG